jgi:FtsP/CotA-like multicopper oxidase with cupredoxin domain
MYATNMRSLLGRRLGYAAITVASVVLATARAAVPGISGTGAPNTFNLSATPAFITEPDGATIYSWGYGCTNGGTATFLPTKMSSGTCSNMQIPGPTLIVTEGEPVTVTLTNALPAAAGNTSILFPGFVVTATGGVPGLLTSEAVPGGTVTYTFTANSVGTHSYYSGTQGDLQIEMGLYGAIVVLPKSPPASCGTALNPTQNDKARGVSLPRSDRSTSAEDDYRLSTAAYDIATSCYDREYLFQFSEIDPKIHRAIEEIANCDRTVTPNSCPAPNLNSVETEPYHPAYYMINGRSMPDDMDPAYASMYPHQPYNGNPHMHPGELTLLRIIGHGRWQHPFHEHGNHVRLLARDGNLLLSATDATKLAGPLLFTTTTTPVQAMDGIFYWTGKGLNWDVFGHGYTGDTTPCVPDANGYYTSVPAASNYYEWCGDHDKALEAHPFGQVGSGGPMTLPDANIVANGPWYGGSPYLGGEAMARAVGPTPIPPSGTVANSPSDEAGFAYMWHSHNEREITTNNIFPGGMLMMMLVDPRAYQIDESK